MEHPVPQYFIDAVIQAVRAIVDRAGIAQRNRQVYETFLNNVCSPNSPLQQNLFETIHQKTGGRWQQGLHEQDLVAILKPWIEEALRMIDERVNRPIQPQQPQSGYYSAVPMGHNPGGYIPMQPMMNTTSNLYGDSSSPAVVQPLQPIPEISMLRLQGDSLASINLGRDVMFELNRATRAELRQTDGGILALDNYQTGAYENERLTTVDITLNVAQNTARNAGLRVFNLAPQEVVRGVFAHVIRYHELFHIPMCYAQFVEVSASVGEAYFRDKDNWRNGMEVLNKRTRSEWSTVSTALCRLINRSIHRRLRTTNGAFVEGIDTVEDLNDLDDRHSKLTVTHHPKYWTAFNTLVTLAFQYIFDPKNLVKPDDITFGDFVHCDQVEFYLDGRSKYDYGTFAEKVDKEKFIEKMLATNTVLRIPRAIVLTNALDLRLVNLTQGYQNKDQAILTKMQTIGTTLLDKIDYLRRGEIEAVLCLDKGVSPERYFQSVNLARTLDDDLALIR